MTHHRQRIVTLDLEGVLVPEIWVAVAERTGIDELRRTTRDEPDYDVLMQERLSILKDHGLTMSMIQDVISTLSPLDGAKEFLDELRSEVQVLILSDTFEQFAQPLMKHSVANDLVPSNSLQMQTRSPIIGFASMTKSVEQSRRYGPSNSPSLRPAIHITTRQCLVPLMPGSCFGLPSVQDEFDFLALEEYPALLRSIRSAFTEPTHKPRRLLALLAHNLPGCHLMPTSP